MPKIKLTIDTELMAEDIQNWVEMMPKDMQTKPLVGLAAPGGETLTPADLVHQVRLGTPLGIQLVEQAISLATGNVFQQMLKEEA